MTNAQDGWRNAREYVTQDYGDLVELICPCGEKITMTDEHTCHCGRIYRMYTMIEVMVQSNKRKSR